MSLMWHRKWHAPPKVLVALLVCASCGGRAPPSPPVLNLTLAGGASQNPDPSGAGNAVMVDVFQLTNTGKFQAIDVYSLSGHESTALGGDAAGSPEQVLLSPGQNITETQDISPGVVAIGVAVLFRDINHSTWKLIAPTASTGPTALTVHIDGLTATLNHPP